MRKTAYLSALMAGLFAVTFSASVLSAKGYGSAGCGLGSMVIGPKGGIVQVFAATTNATGVQTFGITSGTSNCVENAAAFKQKQREIFVSVNISTLEQEMAAGKGEKLNALAGLMGCPVTHKAAFGQMARKQFKQLIAKKSHVTPSILLASMKSNITGDKRLASACSI